MNDFGIDLKAGTHGVFKAAYFYKPHASEKERTFVITGGLGRECKSGGRKLTGHWLTDKVKDTIDSYSLEFVIVDGKKIKQLVTGDPVPDPVLAPEVPEVVKARKPRGRSAWKAPEE